MILIIGGMEYWHYFFSYKLIFCFTILLIIILTLIGYYIKGMCRQVKELSNKLKILENINQNNVFRLHSLTISISNLQNENLYICHLLFKQSSIYEKIIILQEQREKREKERKIFTTKEQEALSSVIFDIYKKYIDRIKLNSPKLTNNDIILICLQMAGLDSLTIALCLGFTNTSTINQRKHRLKKKLNTVDVTL